MLTETRKVSNDFIRVKASGGLDVYITSNEDLSLVVEADENLHDLIKTEVNNGTLYISSKKNIWSARSKKVHLSVENLNEIVVTSGAEIISENTFNTDELKVTATSGAEANLRINVNNLICSASSGADLNLVGKTKNIEANSSSGSDINAYGLEAMHCIAKATSGSDIKVNVIRSFKGEATSGADIRIKGDPKQVQKNNNSGGSIRNSQG